MYYLKVFTDFAVALEPYADAEVGRIFRAMLKYAEDGTDPDFRGNERFIWPSAKQNIERAEEYSNKKSASGAKGGRSNAKQSEATASNAKQSEAKKEREKEIYHNTTPTPPNEGEVQAVVAVWEENIGEVPRVVLQEVISYLSAGVTAELICAAIQSAVKNGAGKWTYVDAILHRCVQERRFTLADWEKGEKKHAKTNRGTDGIEWGAFGTNS